MGSEEGDSAGSGNWVPSAAGAGDSSLQEGRTGGLMTRDHSTLSKRDHRNALRFTL